MFSQYEQFDKAFAEMTWLKKNDPNIEVFFAEQGYNPPSETEEADSE
jgi:hypothetical protein